MLPFIFLGLAGAMVFVNIYFRLKVLRLYKQLLKHGIGIKPGQLIYKKRMEHELLAVYPAQETVILELRKQIIRSLSLALLLWVAVLGVGLFVYLVQGK